MSTSQTWPVGCVLELIDDRDYCKVGVVDDAVEMARAVVAHSDAKRLTALKHICKSPPLLHERVAKGAVEKGKAAVTTVIQERSSTQKSQCFKMELPAAPEL